MSKTLNVADIAT